MSPQHLWQIQWLNVLIQWRLPLSLFLSCQPMIQDVSKRSRRLWHLLLIFPRLPLMSDSELPRKLFLPRIFTYGGFPTIVLKVPSV